MSNTAEHTTTTPHDPIRLSETTLLLLALSGGVARAAYASFCNGFAVWYSAGQFFVTAQREVGHG